MLNIGQFNASQGNTGVLVRLPISIIFAHPKVKWWGKWTLSTPGEKHE